MPYYLPITGGRIDGMGTMWNDNSFFQVLDSGQCVYFLRRQPLPQDTSIFYIT